MLKNLTTADEIRSSFRTFTHLRPHLDEETFVEQALMQIEQGYLISAIIEDDIVVSVAGYRFLLALSRGKFIYIDDLVTHPDARGKGYAGQLLGYVKNLAIENGCKAVHLDSGHIRFDAHRLYLNQQFHISSHHFKLDV